MTPTGDLSASTQATVSAPAPGLRSTKKPSLAHKDIPWEVLRWIAPSVIGPALWWIGLPLPIVIGLCLVVVPLLLLPTRLALITLVPALAFLLAAFPARNSDVLLHLGAGKALAQGEAAPGGEPFAYTSDGAAWVNHAWLTDLLAYLVYVAGQGTALLLLKCLLFAALGVLLLALGWTRNGPGLPAACGFLALLALGQSIPLNPICMSYLFFALTIWLLERARRPGTASTTPPLLRYLPVFLLCALWVNLDSWFLLGPLTIALYLAGNALDFPPASQADQATNRPAPVGPSLSQLALVLGISLVCCLFNPFHVRVFELPPPLQFLTLPAEFKDHAALAVFQSPFQHDYLVGLGTNVGGLAYFCLALVSLISFSLNRRRFHWTWALLWTASFALSAIHVRLIPFFAIVAGPCTSRNLLDWFADRKAGKLQKNANPPVSTAAWEYLTVWTGGLLLVLSWPGWLQAKPFERRDLEVVVDPALERSARQIVQWRKDGLLPSGRHSFNFHIETAHYLAFFASKEDREKVFLDSRFQVYSNDALVDFVRIREGIRPGGRRRTGDETSDWRALLRERKIDRVILSDGEASNLPDLLLPMLRSKEWVLLGLEGRTAVVGWVDPDPRTRENTWEDFHWDEQKLAFHPPSSREAPPDGPGRFPEPPDWSDSFLKSRPSRNPDADEALLLLDYFTQSQGKDLERQQRVANVTQSAALLGLGAPTGTPLGPTLGPTFALSIFAAPKEMRPGPRLSPQRQWLVGMEFQFENGPIGVLWQALRAARRAIKANPDDPRAWLALGEVYAQLSLNSYERYLSLRQPQLVKLRLVQAVTAFQQTILLQPNSPQAHFRLATLYGQLDIIDLHVKHFKEHLRLLKDRGRKPGETEKEFADRRAPLENLLQPREKQLQEIEAKLKESWANKKVLDRAQEARQVGLGGLALDILLDSDAAAFGTQGLILELELLQLTGRARELSEWGKPYINQLGRSSYFWTQAFLNASMGDYDEADKDLAELFPGSKFLPHSPGPINQRTGLGLVLGNMLLDEIPVPGSLRLAQLLPTQYPRMETLLGELQMQADLDVFRGLLALEIGRADQAENRMRRALRLWGSDEAAAAGVGLDFTSRRIAQYYLQRLESSKPTEGR
jgi:Tetratricopeptide repeat